LVREKTALALARMEKQFFLALAYFVRKRLAKRLLLAFQIGKKMSNVQNTLIFLFFSFLFLFFSSFSISFSFLFPFSLLILSAFPSFPLLSPYPIGLSFLLSLLGGVQATTPCPHLRALRWRIRGLRRRHRRCSTRAAELRHGYRLCSRSQTPQWPWPRHATEIQHGRGLGTPPCSASAAELRPGRGLRTRRRPPWRPPATTPAAASTLLPSSQACLMANVVISVK